MAAIEFSVREIVSRVRQAVPDASENYIINLINQGLVDMGRYTTKMEYGKTDLIHNQLWYGLDDDRDITINKIFRVSILNDSDEYIRVPRLLNQEIKVTDTE
tara:strand:- start:74 stop:379 length:306 start_codon:yes stop_codon:yes gene_type:complete